MADSPASVKMEREDKESAAIPEEKAGEPSAILPMTPESKQLAAVIATAVATAMAGKSASPDSSSSMVRYSAGVSLADFHHQLLHPAPLMNSPSSSTCSHLLLVTSSHLDFPGGVMNRLSSPVGVLAP